VGGTGEERRNDTRKSFVGFSDAVADAVDEVEQQRWYAVRVTLCRRRRLEVLVVQSQAVVGGTSHVVGVRTQCDQQVTEAVAASKVRAVDHAF